MEIEGPLGIWPWPVLNALVAISNGGPSQSEDKLVVTEVNRDSQGRIQSIEEVRK